MSYPTCIDMLTTIEATLREKVEPAVDEIAARSALATIYHVLHYIRIAIGAEGQILCDEIAALRMILPRLRDDLARHGTDGRDLALSIGGGLEAPLRDQHAYPSLPELAGEAHLLGNLFHDALEKLIGQEVGRVEEADYAALREECRGHIRSTLVARSRIVDAAYANHDPRR